MTAEARVSPSRTRNRPLIGVAGWRRLAGLSLLTIVGVWLAWRIVGGVIVARGPPELAVLIRPQSALALTAAAEAQFAAGRPDAALDLARRALRRQPFNEVAARVAAEALQSKGQDQRAESLMTLVGNWSLRDDRAQLWLIRQRLLEGDYGSVFAHLDALLRRESDARPALFKLISAALTQDGARSLPALAARLQTNPPWREDLFRTLSANPVTLNAAAQLAASQKGGPAPVTATELGAVLTALSQSNRYADAHRVWTAVWPGAASAATPFNGRFDPLSGPKPFAWSMIAGAGGGGADIVDDDQRPNRTALRVQYDGDSAATFLQTLMVLPPGRYRLAGHFRTEGAGADRLAWSITCGEDGRSLAQIGAQSDIAAAWRPFTGEFTKPDQGCDGQWLSLIARPGERRESVAVWFSDLTVTRAGS